MPSTFFGISIATSALAAQRRAMDVLGYNVAHANDPTYKRQRLVAVEGMVLAQSQEASPLGVSPFGTGVGTGDVERIRDLLIENRLRDATQASANWSFKNNSMAQVEAAVGEPSDSGLQNDIDNFWASWQKVATAPDSSPLRSALLEDTTAMCQRMQYIYRQMSNTISDLNESTIDRVNRVNLIGDEIGRLNNEIGALESGAVPVNDLLNRRDALVLELSKLVAISQHGESKGDFVISIGGRVLVQGTLVNKLECQTAMGGNQAIKWARDPMPKDDVAVSGGELRAILDLRDTIIPDYMNQMNQIAVALRDNVNALHHQGLTVGGQPGGDFFEAGTTAGNLCLHTDGSPLDPANPGIVGRPDLVAASSITNPGLGNGTNAQKIASLKEAAVSGSFTINQMYRAMIGDIGGTAATSTTQSTAHELSLQQLTTQQQSVSGVSLDEEMTNMIKFQQAYNAAARTLTIMNDMLGVLVDTVGR